MSKCAAHVNGPQPLLLLLLLLLASIGLSQQASIGVESLSGNFYTAGVVEFRHATGPNADENLADNLAGYLELIGQANDTAADIIVFPELTLNGRDTASYVPHPKHQLSPCRDDPVGQVVAPFMVAISCAARSASKYIVININEEQRCAATPEDTRPCAPNGYNIFNTNVVFDRNGTIIARYRKIHLYGEPRNTTFVPEPASFETDFNVTFGLFTCFDIMFYKPAHEMLLEQGVRDFIFTTMWFSQLPFLTAVQVQQSWAYSNDVNLLAAGVSHPEYGSTGSGIFNGRAGTISSVMKLDEGERRLYVAQVPKYQRTTKALKRRRRSLPALQALRPEGRSSSSSFTMKRDYLEQYESVWLELPGEQAAGNVSQDVCHGQLCCHFELQWRLLAAGNGSSIGYRLGAYDGWRNEQQVDANYVRNCAIFACNGSSIEDCGNLFPETEQSTLSLSGLLIEATYPKSQEFLLMPNSVLDNLLPLEPAQFEWTTLEQDKSNQLKVRFALAESAALSNLLTFAIYGNYYDEVCTFGTGTPQQDRDCGYSTKGGGAAQLGVSGVFLCFLLSLCLAFYRTT